MLEGIGNNLENLVRYIIGYWQHLLSNWSEGMYPFLWQIITILRELLMLWSCARGHCIPCGAVTRGYLITASDIAKKVALFTKRGKLFLNHI